MALVSMSVVGQPSVLYLRRSQPSSRYQSFKPSSAILDWISSAVYTLSLSSAMIDLLTDWACLILESPRSAKCTEPRVNRRSLPRPPLGGPSHHSQCHVGRIVSGRTNESRVEARGRKCAGERGECQDLVGAAGGKNRDPDQGDVEPAI